MTIRELMLELSKFDGHLKVRVATKQPSGSLEIDAVKADRDADEPGVTLQCHNLEE